MKVLLLNGPNLDRLGTRSPEIYGSMTLTEIVESLAAMAAEYGAELEHLQSSDAEELATRIEQGADALIINPASLTHHSQRLREAIAGFAGPSIEVHISNIATREPYRRHSMMSSVVTGSVIGLGVEGYSLALRKVLEIP